MAPNYPPMRARNFKGEGVPVARRAERRGEAAPRFMENDRQAAAS